MIVHYIFVRKDLPVGVLAAMVTHAAGNSAAAYEQEYRYTGQHFEGATAVVLEAKDEAQLYLIASYLITADIKFTPIYETEGRYHGQLMAIGLIPAEREKLARKLEHFQLLSTCKTELDNYDPEC